MSNRGPTDEEAQEQQPSRGPEEEAAEEDLLQSSGGKALADALKVSFRFLKLAMLALLAIWILRGLFDVEPEEVKVKLRFGKPVEVDGEYVLDSESGLHLCWPWEEVVTVPITEQELKLDEEFWYFMPPGGQAPPSMESLNVKRDGYLLTGDVNLVHLRLTVRYRARSDEQGALDYAFRVDDPAALLRRFVVNSTIKVVAGEEVMDVLTQRKQTVQNDIEAAVSRRLARFEEQNGHSAGVELVDINYVTDPQVPLAVQQAFFEAQQARSEANRLEREAEQQKATIAEQALEKKAELLAEARTYRQRLESRAEADAERIQKLLAYIQSPGTAEVLMERLYARRIEELLSEHSDMFVLHSSGGKNRKEIRVLLSRQMRTGGSAGEEQEGAQQGAERSGRSPAGRAVQR